MQNPLLNPEGLPLFRQIKPEHLTPALDVVLIAAEKELQEVENIKDVSWDNTIGRLDEIGERIHRVWSPISHLMGTSNNAELRKVFEDNRPRLIDFNLRMGQSQKLYSHYRALKDNNEKWLALSPAHQRALEDLIRSAELSGIALAEEPKNEFKKVSQRLSELTTDFSNHVLDATKAFELIVTAKSETEGLPESLLSFAAQSYTESTSKEASPETGPWRFTLDFPSYGPMMQHCKERSIRQKLYEVQVTKASSGEFDNRGTLLEILALRKKKANILGYGSYAELSTKQKMAGSTDEARALLEKLRKSSWDPAMVEKKDVEQFASSLGGPSSLEPWDYPFYSERLREKNYSYREEDLKPYFSLPNVLDGLFSLANRLFKVRVAANDGEEIEKWHKDVKFFEVFNENNEKIAAFFLDPFSRPSEKRGGAWMDDSQGRKKNGAKIQIPVAYLVCNFSPPVGKDPSLLNFREVETLFHEFGHGLQHMLTQVDVPGVSGINGIEWDAVELPSQFMENWCYHEPTLMGLAKHYKTSAALPRELFLKIGQARNFQSAMQMLRQIRFSLTDLALHDVNTPSGYGEVDKIARKVAESTSVTPIFQKDHMLCSFSHIFAGGYAAGYYSYKWAEVLSADAFAAFEDAGLDDPEAVAEVGLRFRDTVLSLGGSLHPSQVFRHFRGRDPEIEALLRHSGLLQAN